MSRSYRGREVFSRRGIMSTPKVKKFTPMEKIDYLNRVINRANKSAGYDSAKKPSTWKYEYMSVDENHYTGEVKAHTKSEARAMIKKHFGIGRNSRLPSSIKVEKVND